jgi:hypothetical protein
VSLCVLINKKITVHPTKCARAKSTVRTTYLHIRIQSTDVGLLLKHKIINKPVALRRLYVRGETAHFWGPFMCVYYGEGIFHHNISEERPQRQKRGIFPEENSAKTDLCCLSTLFPLWQPFFRVFFSSFPFLNFLYTSLLTSTFQPLGSISVPKDSVFFSTLLSSKCVT